jgi:ABC-type branched-subunit amino acid transport system ATPase component/ABC-type branched-subunit amino acid transport system permease subunit
MTAVSDPRQRRRGLIAVGALVALWLVLDFVMPHVISTSHTSTGHWETPLPSVLLGLITGANYGLLSVGLVLIYRSNRVINFAHGEIGAFAASFFGIEVLQWHLPYWAALVPALLLAAVVGMVLDALLVRRLVKAPLVMSVVATLAAGQFLALLALVINSHANAASLFPQPSGLPSFQFGALLISPAYTGMAILAPIGMAAIAAFLKLTRYGRGIRSAATNRDAARMAGVPVRLMSSIAWAVAGSLAALSAILTQATFGFSGGESFGPELLLIALTGAVLGRMKSLPGALLGGLTIGVTQQLLLWNSPETGLMELVLFVGIVLALFAQRQSVGRAAEVGAWSISQIAHPLPARVRAVPSVRLLVIAPWLALGGLLAVLPMLVSNATSIKLAITFGFVIVAMSIGIVTGLGGQLSLGQFAVAAVGAYASFEVSRRTGNFFESFACAGVAGAIACVGLGLPSIKSRGPVFSVTSLAFALVVPDYLIGRSWVLGDGQDPGRPIVFHHAFESGHSYYYVGFVTLVVATAFSHNVRRGGLGRRLVAVRDNEDVARSFTVNATWVKVQGFGLAGAVAGLGGAMYGHALSQIGADGFPATASLDVVKIAVVGGVGSLTGPMFGAVAVQGVSYVTVGSLALALISLAQLLIILFLPGGLVQFVTSARDRCARVLARRAGVDLTDAGTTARTVGEITTSIGREAPRLLIQPRSPVADDGDLLEVRDLRKSFAGVQALRGLDLTVATGEIVGLIGPNGAGKTTTFELVAGFLRPDSGTVRYRGTDVTRLTPQARARVGMIRSFQDAALFPTLTVAECVALAMERRDGTSVLRSLLGIDRGESRKVAEAAEVIAWMGLEQYRTRRVRELSTGTRRIVELACAVALEPQLLLLDEPSSGIAQRETEALGELLARLRGELSLTLVVIEHDIPLITGLSDRVVCMAAGDVIAIGTPMEIQADPAVIEAYLGN